MRILITAPYNENGRKVLSEKLGEIIYRPWKLKGRAYDEGELMILLRETKADALITEHDQVTAKLIRNFPDLAFIGVCRGTPSNVAVETAEEKGIPVFHTPARNAQAVAEMFIANVVSFLRNTIPAVKWLESAQWKEGAQSSYLEFKGNELAGKTVGMVGFGAIGQAIARLLKPWPCEIRYYDPFLKTAIPGCKETSLEGIFETCDIVSIHLPANEQTAGIIGKSLLSKMKRNAIFVNTARSMVVNQDDLLEMLEDKRIGGAIIDVFDQEPPDARDYKLIRLGNVLATPHIAGATFEVEDHHVDIMNRQLLDWYDKIHAFPEPSGNGQKNDKHSK